MKKVGKKVDKMAECGRHKAGNGESVEFCVVEQVKISEISDYDEIWAREN